MVPGRCGRSAIVPDRPEGTKNVLERLFGVSVFKMQESSQYSEPDFLVKLANDGNVILDIKGMVTTGMTPTMRLQGV